MGKRCIICNEEAEYRIRNSTECYCPECAAEHFGDISLLEEIEQQAQQLRQAVAEQAEKDHDEQ